jgi:hypothetical protein
LNRTKSRCDDKENFICADVSHFISAAVRFESHFSKLDSYGQPTDMRSSDAIFAS